MVDLPPPFHITSPPVLGFVRRLSNVLHRGASYSPNYANGMINSTQSISICSNYLYHKNAEFCVKIRDGVWLVPSGERMVG